MKRSEMIDAIAEAMQRTVHTDGDWFDTMAKAALKACEDAGMLPPETILGTYNEDFIPAWEPEGVEGVDKEGQETFD